MSTNTPIGPLETLVRYRIDCRNAARLDTIGAETSLRYGDEIGYDQCREEVPRWLSRGAWAKRELLKQVPSDLVATVRKITKLAPKRWSWSTTISEEMRPVFAAYVGDEVLVVCHNRLARSATIVVMSAARWAER